MLMEVKCAAVPAIEIRLVYDDESVKKAVVSTGDLIDVTWYKDGRNRRIQGKVTKVSANGSDPKGWVILVDGSGDYTSETARIVPSTITDIDIIRKYDTQDAVMSPKGGHNIIGLREYHGRIQYTKNGIDWLYPLVDRRDIIFDPDDPHFEGKDCPPRPRPIRPEEGSTGDDGEVDEFDINSPDDSDDPGTPVSEIEDENY